MNHEECLRFHFKPDQAPRALARQLMLLGVNHDPGTGPAGAGTARAGHGLQSHGRRDAASRGKRSW